MVNRRELVPDQARRTILAQIDAFPESNWIPTIRNQLVARGDRAMCQSALVEVARADEQDGATADANRVKGTDCVAQSLHPVFDVHRNSRFLPFQPFSFRPEIWINSIQTVVLISLTITKKLSTFVW